ncbi:MAG: hypothetical protein E6Q97_29310 [Desulfurellales bacterium]|nr:MAG: hypothetical protein E6Q97_29310 [Desulfurellales bacterium]
MGILDIDENEDPVVRQMAAQKAMQYYVQNQGKPGALAASILGSRYGFRPDARAEMTQNALAKMKNQTAEMDLQRDQYDFEAEKNVRGMLQQFDWTKPDAQNTFVQELMKNGRFKEAQAAKKMFSGAGNGSYGGNLTTAYDKNGNLVFLQTNSGSGVTEVQGYTPAPDNVVVKGQGGGVYVIPKRGAPTPTSTGLVDPTVTLGINKENADNAKASDAVLKDAAGRVDTYRSGVKQANDILTVAPQIEKLLPLSTGSGAGALRDAAGNLVGISTQGSQAAAQLKVLSNKLLMAVPRFEGPQSDKDTATYREAAGSIGDSTLPAETRLAALRTVQQLAAKQRDTMNGALKTELDRVKAVQQQIKNAAPGNQWQVSPATQSKRDQTRAQILTQEYADEQSLLEQAKKSGDPNKVLLHQKNLEALQKEMGNARVPVPTSSPSPAAKTAYTLTGRAKMMKPEQKAAIDRIIKSGDAAAIQKLRDNGLLQ